MSVEQTSMNQLITDNIDIWTSTVKTKSASGRGSSKKRELYGVKKLRELILELAVRGKLVPQDPTDEPASILLERIAAEKAQLVKDKKIKKQKSFGEVRNDEALFELPLGWQWTRLSELSEIGPRNSDVEDESEASFVPMPMISTSYKGDHGSEVRSWKDIKKGYTHFRDGDIALAKITPCFENSKAAVFSDLKNGVGTGTTELHVARPISGALEPLFVLLYLKAPMFLKVGETQMTGSAGQKRVPKDFFAGNPLPYPPLKEQKRIVAKVDELMTLCDQLEQQTEASIEAHQVLVTTLLDTLTNSADAEELMQNWARISEHFDTLFTTEASIDQLSKCIVTMASLGLLSKGDAKSLLDRELVLEIALKEKEGLLKNGVIKNEKVKELIISTPFEVLPKGWVACSLNDVTSCLDHKRVPIKKSERTEGKVPYYGANGPVGFIGEKLFDEELVLVVEDETFIGRTKPFSYRVSGPSWVNNHAHVLKCTSVIVPDFLNILLSYYPLVPLTSGTTGRKKLTKNTLLQLPIILPSIPEQFEILKIVDELNGICEKLKASIKYSQATQLNLTEAIVEQAV
ncbi:restriction endonuclease subunit S [Vibrio cyclitrophicus]